MLQAAFLAVATACACVLCLEADAPIARPVQWEDLPPAIERRLIAAGLDAQAFTRFREEQQRLTEARVRESDLDALIYYALQSVAFTDAPPIEPAVAAKAFVERLDAESRARLLSDGVAPSERVPVEVRERLAELIPALRYPSDGSRLAHFRDLLAREQQVDRLPAFLVEQFVRTARFLYEKEFVAPTRQDSVEAIAALYRQRALSTDTSVEASYLVHLGLATIRAAEGDRRIRRVLIVGPGLELAPRTGLLELGPPQSYQPYAILDSLVALGLARLDDVALLCVDVNPRVADHLQRLRAREVELTLVSGVADSPSTRLSDDYRRYFNDLGRTIGRPMAVPNPSARYRGHLLKKLEVGADALRALDATRADVSLQRLTVAPFDLIIATNVFLYMEDIPLTLALASFASMLAPGGVLIHNETRALVSAVAMEQQMPIVHARTAQIASVQGAAAPLYDRVFVHLKQSRKP